MSCFSNKAWLFNLLLKKECHVLRGTSSESAEGKSDLLGSLGP